MIRRQPYGEWFGVVDGMRAEYTDAGHILGSASVVLEVDGGRRSSRDSIFSGDVGRAGLPIIRDPEPPTEPADLVIMESTYGDRDHESVAAARDHLARVVRETAARGGRVLIPAFAVGRAQELVYDLHVLARDGAIPPIPIVIDSPLATAATEVFERNNADLLDRTEAPVREIERLFRFDSMSYTSSTEESKALNDRAGPLIIIAGSGMAEGGRILHHLEERRVESAEHRAHRRLPSRAHAWTADRRAAAGDSRVGRRGRAAREGGDSQRLQRARRSNGAGALARRRSSDVAAAGARVPRAR